MNIYAWISLIGAFVIMTVSFIPKSGRTKQNIILFIKITAIIIVIIVLTSVMKVSFILSYITGIILYILLDRKTYTKKRLIIYGSIFMVIGVVVFFLFRSNPAYVLKHLANNPETTSLYVSKNDENVIDYQADIPRPLASVVKIIIAVEYAYQVDSGILAKDDSVSLEVLERYYIKDSDGGAHSAWLKQLEDEKVTLHDVANGMIEFSSNANTDYLINLLGVDNINKRIEELDLVGHDDVYPLVGALLASQDYKKEKGDSDWLNELRNMTDEQYKNLTLSYSEKMKNMEIDLDNLANITIKEQRVWSDRLPGAPAATYGKLFNVINNGDFPEGVTAIMQDLMEWPTTYKDFAAVGAKGGSTAFVLNQAIYIKTKNSDQFEIVFFTDDLSLWQSIMIRNNAHPFFEKMVGDEEFLQEVQNTLSE